MNSNRYDTVHFTKSQFEHGSRDCVLKNLFGLCSKRAVEMAIEQDEAAAMEYLAANA